MSQRSRSAPRPSRPLPADTLLDPPPAPVPPRTVFRPEALRFADEDRRGRRGRIIRKASLRNLAYSRPLRSEIEDRVLRQLVWQWWLSPAHGKWPARKMARLLGLCHRTVLRYVRRFRSDPARWRQTFAASPPATFDQLLRARQETERQRRLGLARPPLRFRRYTYLHDGKPRKTFALTQTAYQRRIAAGPLDPPPSAPPKPCGGPRIYPRCSIFVRHRWRQDGSCRCGVARDPSRPCTVRRYPRCRFGTAHSWRDDGTCRCGLLRKDFPNLVPQRWAPARSSRPWPWAMRDSQGRLMGLKGRPFDPSALSHGQLPLWARGILFEPLPAPPPSGAGTHFAPAPPPPPLKPIHFARHRRPRR